MTRIAEPSAPCGFIPREIDALEARIEETNTLIGLLTEKLGPLLTPPKIEPAGQGIAIPSVDGEERSQIANRIDGMWERVTRQNNAIGDLIARIDV